jgi:hypothetical protein
MIKLYRLGVIVAGTACLAASGNALMIDDFSDGPDSLVLSVGTGTLVQEETGFSILGNQRDTTLTVIASPYSQQTAFEITGNTTSPAGLYSSGIGDQGWVQLDYGGLHVLGDTPPGLNADVSADNSFQLTFLQTNTAVQVDVTASTYGLSGDQVSVGSFVTSDLVTSPTNYTLNFADMAIASGSSLAFDPSNLSVVSVRMTPVNAGGDFAVGSFSTSPVPEPASLAALSIGAIGLLKSRKRKRA